MSFAGCGSGPGDSPVTTAGIARKVGLSDAVSRA
jgi:hypothetical protein